MSAPHEPVGSGSSTGAMQDTVSRPATVHEAVEVDEDR